MTTCKTCKWHEIEPIDEGYVCVNADSPYVADWTEETDSCCYYEGIDNEYCDPHNM